MNDLENLKKKLLYRSNYRGTKEMDILLSTFVKFYINKLNRDELIELDSFLNLEDELIYNIYQTNEHANDPNFENIIKLLKKFKI
jgi:antitoxin CptB